VKSQFALQVAAKQTLGFDRCRIVANDWLLLRVFQHILDASS